MAGKDLSHREEESTEKLAEQERERQQQEKEVELKEQRARSGEADSKRRQVILSSPVKYTPTHST